MSRFKPLPDLLDVEPERIVELNPAPVRRRGRYVLYWMQQSQRIRCNPALEYAIARANELQLPVVTVFGLFADYPEANERHFAFMLEGLAEVATGLRKRRIRFVVRTASPEVACMGLASEAVMIVCDRGYLRHQKRWRTTVARDARCLVVQVEGDVAVPVELASGKREYAARTLRPKIGRRLEAFLRSAPDGGPVKSSLRLDIPSDVDPVDVPGVLSELRIDRSVGRAHRFLGGTTAGWQRLQRFLHGGLRGYAKTRNDPADPQCSNLSPYFHFGQISPVEVAAEARAAAGGGKEDQAAFIEQLIVRRELAVNFVHFENDYDRYRSLPNWAKATLAKHRTDQRGHVYRRCDLEAAATHDRYWNAAMTEMLRTGYMHNYMRMYWGKKILAWTRTPEHAYRTVLALNNKYFLDGRDPVSFASVGWLFGLHDRPWTERAVFGTVRYMNAGGLERKFNIDGYVRWTQSL